jgi:hypothetical protein
VVPLDLGWLGCFQRPAACPAGADDAQGYYQQPLPPLPPPLDTLLGQLYGSIGYVSFLGFTVGDTSGAWDDDLPLEGLPLQNPSLSLPALLERLALNGAVLALAPAGPAVAGLAGWLAERAPGTEAAVRAIAGRPKRPRRLPQ